jgi:two-component system chemotaxis response regulator CheB
VPGRIYVAPPDRHLIVDGTRLRLVISAKENFARPAIDPLMRSVAIERGTRAIGVILTGQLDDGAAGLEALRKCGGATIVQDPGDAFAGDMPRHAVPFADHVLRLAAIAPRLVELTQSSSARPRPHAPPMRDGHARLRLEQHAASGPSDALQTLSRFASPSLFTCPECSGALWRISGSRMLRYRCHTGHAYSWASLAHGRADDVERTLMEALRALHERQQMSETLGEHFGRTGELVAQQHEENTARRAAEAAGVLRTILAAS